MSTDRDTTRIVRSWLEEGVTALPDRVLDAVLDQVPATPQRRSWWPARRVGPVSNPVKFALASAAIVVVAFVGLRFLSPSIIGPGGPTPSPTSTINPGADFSVHPGGDLTPGPYFIDSLGPFRVVFNVPAVGWQKNIAANFVWTTDSEGRVGFLNPPNLYLDPCHWIAGATATFGPAADDFAARLGSLPGLAATTTDVTVSGFRAKLVEFVPPEDQAACTGGEMRLYSDVSLEPGRHRTWVIDIGGSRLILNAVERTALAANLRSELQRIVDSIRIESR